MLIVCLLAGVYIASRYFPVREWVGVFVEWAQGAGWRGKLLFGGVIIGGIILCLWGTPFTIAAGVAFGPVWGTVVTWFSSGIGVAVPFLIARYLARHLIERHVEKNSKFRAVDRAVRREGWKIVGLLRLDPLIPFNISNYLLGLTSISFGAYLAASMAAMLPGTILYVYLGHIGKVALVDGTARLGWEHYVLVGGSLVFTVGVMLYLARLAKKALAEADAEIAEKEARG
jgi:uncharacterized membrane protein YdjX (TVP38/TMEM64 family)